MPTANVIRSTSHIGPLTVGTQSLILTSCVLAKMNHKAAARITRLTIAFAGTRAPRFGGRCGSTAPVVPVGGRPVDVPNACPAGGSDGRGGGALLTMFLRYAAPSTGR